MARLQDIALEVFEKIASQLNKQDQKSLRLVDKHASIFAKSTVFKCMIMPPARTSITKLMQTLASEQFDDMACHVRHLSWNGLNVDTRDAECLDKGAFESALKKFVALRELKLALQADTPEVILRAFFDVASSADRDLVSFSVDGKGKPLTNSDTLIDLFPSFTSELDTYYNAGLTLRRPVPPGLPPSLPLSTLHNLRSLHVRSGMMKSFQNQVIYPLSLAIQNCPNLTHLTLDFKGPLAISKQRSYSLPTPRLADIFSEVSPDLTLKLEQLTVQGMITDIPPSIERHFRSLKRVNIGHLHDSAQHRFWKVLRKLNIRLESITSWLDTGIMEYLSSYRGVFELDLDVGGAIGTSSWLSEGQLEACFQEFFDTAIAPHCDSIKSLHLPDDYYCSVTQGDISVLKRCTQLESLRVAFDPKAQIYPCSSWDYLATLLRYAIEQGKLSTIHLCPNFDSRDVDFDSSFLDSLDSGGSENIIDLDRDDAKRQSMRDRVQKMSFVSEMPLRPLTLHYQQGVFELEKSTEDDMFRFRLISEEKSPNDAKAGIYGRRL